LINQYIHLILIPIEETKMGHKGVSKRKPPKEKLKPLATANRGSGPVSALTQAGAGADQLPGKARGVTPGHGDMNPSSGSKKKNKKH
jgi:hypothetical protein